MKHPILLIVLIFILFNISFCSNLFFQWRITDTEKKQLEKETFELIKSNVELAQKIVSNYEKRAQVFDDEPILRLSRYTHCQKCLDFVRQFRAIKEKYGFDKLFSNLKTVLCQFLTGMFDEDVCRGFVDKYGPSFAESFFTKFFSGYFFCEKIDLCPVDTPKNYLIADTYAKNLLEKKTSRSKEQPKENGKVIRMAQITDLHVDPKYQKGYSGNCNKPICCRNDSKSDNPEPHSGKYGFEGKCDIPKELLESFVEDVINRNIDFMIWTGDNAPHDTWEGEQPKVYEIAETIKKTIDSKFKNSDTKIPVFYSLGNHEKYPNDDYKDNESEMLEEMAKIFDDYLDGNAKSTFKEGGYYSMKYKDTNLRIIALNCLVCDCFNFNLFNSTKEHAKNMFRWLEQELQNAEKNNEFVYILNHFPLNGDFTLTECAKRMQALFDRYEYNIRGIFSGHTHLDDIEGISEYFNHDKIIHLNYIAPAFTTFTYLLPSYRIYTIDEETMQVLDYEQIRFNLTKSNEEEKPYWYSAYNATKFFGVKNMSEYDKILNVEDIEGYLINRYAGSQNGINNKKDAKRQKEARCVMKTNNFDEYFQCLDPEVSLSYDFLYVFNNFFIGPFEDFD